MTTGKRYFIAKGKGYLNAAGPQSRFILFLLFTLVSYTLLLRVFQKLAEIVQLPVFLPISLVSLLVFVGIVGTVYSHKFVGPMVRIQRAINQMAEGDMLISLRLRDTDDPMLKDLVSAIGLLCDHSVKAHSHIQNAAWELFGDLQAFQEKVERGADASELKAQVESMRKKQEVLDKAIKSFRKA